MSVSRASRAALDGTDATSRSVTLDGRLARKERCRVSVVAHAQDHHVEHGHGRSLPADVASEAAPRTRAPRPRGRARRPSCGGRGRPGLVPASSSVTRAVR